MSDAVAAPNSAPPGANRLVSELKVSGHLMNLDPGLFCIVQTPSRHADPATGLPGVRISLPPGIPGRPDAIAITAFRPDGWLAGTGDAALVRVSGGPGQVLVTVYQPPGAEAAPNIQVLRLIEPGGAQAPVAAAAAAASQPQAAPATLPMPTAAPELMDLVAHVQGQGDTGGRLGEWLGDRGGNRWIEGFAIAPTRFVAADDIEYQAVLGRGWISPWVEGGQFCGSRGMALPILGLRARLRGAAAEAFDLEYSASFVDGSTIGPVTEGAPCETANLAAVEAILVAIRPKGSAAEPVPAAEPEKPVARPKRAGKAR